MEAEADSKCAAAFGEKMLLIQVAATRPVSFVVILTILMALLDWVDVREAADRTLHPMGLAVEQVVLGQCSVNAEIRLLGREFGHGWLLGRDVLDAVVPMHIALQCCLFCLAFRFPESCSRSAKAIHSCLGSDFSGSKFCCQFVVFGHGAVGVKKLFACRRYKDGDGLHVC